MSDDNKIFVKLGRGIGKQRMAYSFMERLARGQRFPRRGWWSLRIRTLWQILFAKKSRAEQLHDLAEDLERQHRDKWEMTEEQQAVCDRLLDLRLAYDVSATPESEMTATMTQAEIDTLTPWMKKTSPIPGDLGPIIQIYGMNVEVVG